MILTGQVLDSSNKPLKGAIVYLSDSTGKPKGANSSTTDDKGRYRLTVAKTDFVTARLVGYEQRTLPASSSILIPSAPMSNLPPMNALTFKLNQSSESNLPEVEVQTTPEPETKKRNWVKIGLIAGGSLLALGLIVYLATRGKSTNK
jgi:hypothetical protein